MIQVQIWGDFECPYSYFQTIVLKKLKAEHDHRIEIVWKAFELSTIEGKLPPSESYISSFEMTKEEPIVAEKGLNLLIPKFLTCTRFAQESVYLANHQGLSIDLAIGLFEAFFLQGVDIGDKEIVMSVASKSGIDSQLLKKALDNSELTKDMRADEYEFETYGFKGLPAMLIGERNFSPKSFMPINGYKTYDELTEILESFNI
jgi:predicted DsbA family dithiol-disulfide isomerase